MQSIIFSRVVDCSHCISETIPLWEGDPQVGFEQTSSLESDGFVIRRFSMGEHSGTHINAPCSFFNGKVDIAAFAAGCDNAKSVGSGNNTGEHLVVPIAVAHMPDKAQNDALYMFTCDDLNEWEQQHGRVQEGTLFALCTGWSDKWNDAKAFMGLSAGEKNCFPSFHPDAVAMLVHDRKAAGIAIDTHGVDPPQGHGDELFPCNTLALSEGKIVLECVANLEEVPPVGGTMVIGVLKLAGGTGSPVALTVFIP